MRLSHRVEDNNIYVVPVEGNIALETTTEELRNYFETLFEDDSAKGLIINFEKVTFIDSAGLGMLALLFNTFKKRQIKLALCSLNSQIQELFEITILDKVLNIYSTEEAALEALRD